MGLNRYCYDCKTNQHWPGECPKQNHAGTEFREKRNAVTKDTVTNVPPPARADARKGAERKLGNGNVAAGKETISASGLRHCPTCTCGEKRVHASNADRQRAYRERKSSTSDKL